MEKKKEKILKQALEAIKKHKIFFVNDLIAYLPISTSTLYEYFPAESEQMEIIRSEIEQAKISVKAGLRKKMYDSDNPTAMLALYRLASNSEEHRLLNQQYIENNIKTDKPIFNIKPIEEEELDAED